MPTITSAQSGLASAAATWVGGIVPAEGDKVIIAAGHVVEIDGTYTWGDNSVTTTIPNAAINVSGTLKASRSANSSLTCKGLLLNNVNATIDYGTPTDRIPNGITADLILNKATTPAHREGLRQVPPTTTTQDFWLYFCGATPRRRNCFLAANAAAGQNQLVLDGAACNWEIGDTVVLFPTTNNSSNDEREIKVVQAVSGNTITLTTNLSYLHIAGSPAMNMNSNVTVRSHNEVAAQTAAILVAFGSSNGREQRLVMDNAAFRSLGQSAANSPFIGLGGLGLSTSTLDITAKDSAFMSLPAYMTTTLFNNIPNMDVVLDNCAVLGFLAYSGSGIQRVAAKNSNILGGIGQSTGVPPHLSFENCFISGHNASNYGGGLGNGLIGASFRNCTFSGRMTEFGNGVRLLDCDVGATFGYTSQYGDNFIRMVTAGYLGTVYTEGCTFDANLDVPASAANIVSSVSYLNFTYKDKGGDPTQQEIWTQNGKILRSNGETKRGNASLALAPYRLATDHSREIAVPCAFGASIRIVGYVKADTSFYNGGGSGWTAPTVTISGNGITPVTFTASSAANNDWEQYDLSATNSSGATGDFTVTFTANAKSVTTGTVYFDGVPDAPFVTQCRHYGFLFDEISPTRTVNPYTVASEATAIAYTGVTLNNGTKRITFSAGTADTAQKFYDYAQAWCCADLSRQVPLARAGALFALTSGWTVSEPTYTGLTWGGGNIEWASPGTKSGSFDSCDFTFTAAGAYNFTDATFGGTIELINTSGGAVTVTVPAGTSITNTGPNITVNYTSVTRGLDFSFIGGTAARVVKLFDTGTQTLVATLSAPDYLWSESVAGSRTLDYTVLEDGYLPVRVTGVTVTGALTGGVQAVQVQQTASRAWVAPSGLTYGTNLFYNAATKRAGLTVASTLQNLYCQLLKSFRTEASLANKPFPMTENGPNSFRWIDGSGFDLTTYPASIAHLSRDGMSYTDGAGVVTDIWAAILSVGVPAGFLVRYQQQDGLGTTNAQVTGNIDQLVKIYQAGAGGFDYRNWLVLKVQKEGYDQAEAVAQDIYGTLEDQLYVFGLTPIPNGIAAGSADATVTVTPESTPALWNGSYFSTTITDTTDAHTGLQIMQAVRAANQFNWSDLVRPNGDKFKTVTGNFYGDTYLTPAGVRVVKADGVTPHPDFNLFNDDSGGSPYVPPVIAPITWAGALNGTTVLLYNDSDGGALIDTQAVSGSGGYVWSLSLPHGSVAVGDSLRLRYGHKSYYAGELQGTMTASGLSFVGTMVLHPIYAGWGLDGAVYDQANGGPFTMDGLNLEIDIGGGAGTGTKKALAAWTQHLMTLPAGLDAFYGAWDLLDLNQIRQNVGVIDVLIDKPTAGQFVFTDNDVNYYRSDFSIPYNTTHSTIFMTYNAKPYVATVASSYAITGDISTVLTALGDVPTAGENAAAVRSELAVELARVDATVSSRLPTAGYTAPDNAGIADIDAKTESLALIQDKTDLLTITDGLVHAEVKKINGVTLAGGGTEADPMRPA